MSILEKRRLRRYEVNSSKSWRLWMLGSQDVQVIQFLELPRSEAREASNHTDFSMERMKIRKSLDWPVQNMQSWIVSYAILKKEFRIVVLPFPGVCLCLHHVNTAACAHISIEQKNLWMWTGGEGKHWGSLRKFWLKVTVDPNPNASLNTQKSLANTCKYTIKAVIRNDSKIDSWNLNTASFLYVVRVVNTQRRGCVARWTTLSRMISRRDSTVHPRRGLMLYATLPQVILSQVIIGAPWDETADVISSKFGKIDLSGRWPFLMLYCWIKTEFKLDS